MGIIMALLRTGGFSRRNLSVRLAEALMCSFLSTGVTILGVKEFGWDYEYATPCGVFISYLGTDFIHKIIAGLVSRHTNIDVSADDVANAEEVIATAKETVEEAAEVIEENNEDKSAAVEQEEQEVQEVQEAETDDSNDGK